MNKDKNIIPVILAGGSGTRLWPLSSKDLPKQFLKILGKRTLLEETILRFLEIAPKEIYILGNSNHKELLTKNLPDTSTKLSIILEPLKKNTAPAITISALKADADDYLLVTPSDHFLPEPDLLIEKIKTLMDLDVGNSMILFGIEPTYPSQSYGYIQKGKQSGSLYDVLSFKEKPDNKTADSFLKKKEYLWNSGIFLFKAKDLLNEMEVIDPLMLKLCRKALKHSTTDGNSIYISKEDYEDLENISIDFAFLESSKSLKVAEINTTWEDLGTWKSIKDHSSKDIDKNTLIGNVQTNDVSNSYINTDKKNLIVSGIEDLLVVDINDQLLITHTDSINSLENLTKNLNEPEQLSDYTIRPWGRFKTLMKSHNCHVKLLIVEIDGKLSLQKHKHRSEHWTVTAGKARVVKGQEEIELAVDNSIKIEKGEVHRITNIGDEELNIIEVQIGDYFGEDDIQRFDDVYDRK